MKSSAFMRFLVIFASLSLLAGAALWAATDSGAAKKDPTKEQKSGEQQSKENEQAAVPPEDKIEITVTAPRVEIPLKKNPAATTVVETPILQTMPRTIGIDEVMKLVPGVKVDNQADGERVHLSIRGEGILTERGTRGIKTLVDGIPLNDPSGYVSDFFDVDWATVRRV